MTKAETDDVLIERVARTICLSLAASRTTVDTMMAMRGDDYRAAAHAVLATMRVHDIAPTGNDPYHAIKRIGVAF